MTPADLLLYATATVWPVLLLAEALIPARWQPGLPAWDRLFGTYREGVAFRQRVGFAPAASRRWLAMLCFRDVHAVAAAPAEGSVAKVRA